ncbi:hypothetical protein HDV05_004348 [Chytridiales sp. JEL 0842]|nr:hypothetical protein HDV05_004348 [Chytridiales sp. JEL 0842]
MHPQHSTHPANSNSSSSPILTSEAVYLLTCLVSVLCGAMTVAVFLMVHEFSKGEEEELRALLQEAKAYQDQQAASTAAARLLENNNGATNSGLWVQQGAVEAVEAGGGVENLADAEGWQVGVGDAWMEGDEVFVQVPTQEVPEEDQNGDGDDEENNANPGALVATQAQVLPAQIELPDIEGEEEVVNTLPEPLPGTPPPPRPLARRDSTQSEDYDMNALHFFAISNRDPADIATLCRIAKEQQTQREKQSSSSSSNETLGRASPFHIDSPCRFIHLTPLHLASMNSTPQTLSTLLSHGANINAQDSLGRTPLRHAAALSRIEILESLLQWNAQDLPDKEGVSVLQWACVRGDTPILRSYVTLRPWVLVEPLEPIEGVSGLQKNKRKKKGLNPETGLRVLHVLCSLGHLEAVRVLVGECGADANVRDAQGRTGLMYAYARGRVDVAEALMEFADVEEVEKEEEEEGGLVEATPAIVEKVKLMHAAEGTGESETTLAAADVDEDDARESRPQQLESEDSDDDTPLSNLSTPTPTRLDLLAVDQHGWTALHYATSATPATPSLLRLLLSHAPSNKSLLNAQETKFGLTPLMMASKFGHAESIKILLDAGADVRAETWDGRTAVCFAAWSGESECLLLLLKAFNKTQSKCNVGSDIKRLSPLHLAIRDSNAASSIIKLILENSNVNLHSRFPVRVPRDPMGAAWTWSSLGYTTGNCKGRGDHISTQIPICLIDPDQTQSQKDAANVVYFTPLLFALAAGHTNVAQTLLTHHQHPPPQNKHASWVSSWVPNFHNSITTTQYLLLMLTLLSRGELKTAGLLTYNTRAGWVVALGVLGLLGMRVFVVGVPPGIDDSLLQMASRACLMGSQKSGGGVLGGGCGLGCVRGWATSRCCLISTRGGGDVAGTMQQLWEAGNGTSCWVGRRGVWSPR